MEVARAAARVAVREGNLIDGLSPKAGTKALAAGPGPTL
jgi:hypothetical protein